MIIYAITCLERAGIHDDTLITVAYAVTCILYVEKSLSRNHVKILLNEYMFKAVHNIIVFSMFYLIDSKNM